MFERAVLRAGLAFSLPLAGMSLADEPAPQERVAALKQSLADSQAKIRQYEWIETTTVSLKGEQKARKQNRCYHDADGEVQKIALDQPAEEEPKGRGRRRRGGRVKQKIVEKKKAELTAEMQRAVELIHMYVPPDPALIQRAKDEGRASMEMIEAGKRARLAFRDYLQAGDTFAIDIDPGANALLGASVRTYVDQPDDPVTLDVSFANLPDGASYPDKIDLVVASQKLAVAVEQSDHRKVAQ